MAAKIFILLVLLALSYASELTSRVKTSEEGESLYLCDNDDCLIVRVLLFIGFQFAQISSNPEFASAMKKSVARRTATSCNELCRQANKGDGKIVGTAPLCARKCGRDCPDSKLCTIATRTWSVTKSAAVVSFHPTLMDCIMYMS